MVKANRLQIEHEWNADLIDPLNPFHLRSIKTHEKDSYPANKNIFCATAGYRDQRLANRAKSDRIRTGLFQVRLFFHRFRIKARLFNNTP